jgi:hypothetical protein
MPEPLLYLKAMGTAAVASALIVLAMASARRPASATRLNSACVLGLGCGLALGYLTLSLRVAWPPANGLDRFLTIVVPAALGIEWFAGVPRVARWLAWFLRISLAATVARILLHDSVYLSDSGSGGTPWESVATLTLCGVLLVALWGLLAWLAERSPGVSISLTLALAIQCSGVTVMMAGYIQGGAATIPLAAALVGTALGIRIILPRCDTPTIPNAAASFAAPAILGVGVVGLFGVLFIGNFFGRISTGSALVMLLAPLLCWTTEFPVLRNRKPLFVGSLRLVLVAIPLVMLLVRAKRDFDRDMAPLLRNNTGLHSSSKLNDK